MVITSLVAIILFYLLANTNFMVYFINCADDGAANNNNNVYVVYRLVPETKLQLNILRHLFITNEQTFELDFWKEPSRINNSVDIMVNPQQQSKFLDMLKWENLTHSILIPDVEKLIIEREHKQHKKWKNTLLFDHVSTSKDITNNNGTPWYNIYKYQSHEKMNQYLKFLEQKYPNIAKVMNLGHTFEGRLIKTIKISNPINSTGKRALWIDAGIHAREWVSHVTAMYFVHKLITNYGKDDQTTQYVNNFTWYITPNVNPDGYEFSRRSTDPKVRGWRKNRVMRPGCNPRLCCSGVDLNRNFDIYWSQYGSSDNRCSHNYQGEAAFSELETQAIRDFVAEHRRNLDAFITLHAHSQFWVYPYGYQPGSYPFDVQDLRVIARRAVKAIKAMYGTVYTVGSSADLLGYAASGGSDDWAKSKMGVKFVYLVELPPQEYIDTGYIFDEAALPPLVKETWEGVKVVADAIRTVEQIRARRLQKYYENAAARNRPARNATSSDRKIT